MRERGLTEHIDLPVDRGLQRVAADRSINSGITADEIRCIRLQDERGIGEI